MPSDTFATRLLIARSQRDMTQQQAADACGINRATWALWEGGSSPRNMADVVMKIAAGLGVDRDWLLWGGPLSHPSGPDRGPGLAVSPITERYTRRGSVGVRESRHSWSRYCEPVAA